ncbi:MAG: hypothetical protein Q4C47_02760 [Planctomycetia bacterium]|nr:hypothetical protein [Planctomycetia bacterium]
MRNGVTRRDWLRLVGTLAILSGCAGRSSWVPVRPDPDADTGNVGEANLAKAPHRPSRYVVAADPLVIHSDCEISSEAPMIREARSLQFGLTAAGLPVPEEPVHIYLFDSEPEFLVYAMFRIPGFTDRRAFFVQTPERLEVYAFVSDELPVDLRHEVTHGYLHAANPGIALWLDEGLAEYAEVPANQRGRHPEHEQTLRRLTSEPLQWMSETELEREIAVLARMNEPATMTALDYARCWRVVRQLFQTESGRQKLRELLRPENQKSEK